MISWLAIAFAALLPARAEELLEIRSSRPLQAEAALEALEPWETPVEGFFIRSHHGHADVDASRWVLEIDGAVEKPLRLTLAELRKAGSTSLHAVLQCAGNGRGRQEPPVAGIQWRKGAVGNAEWTGVPLSAVLALARPKPSARFGRIEGADAPALASVPAFVRSVPLDKLRKDALLAWGMNRKPLPLEHGGPLRLVLPDWYGQNWIKWVTRITLTEQEDAGFYMRKGYRMPKAEVRPGEAWDPAAGDPIQELRVHSILVSPKPGETVPAGEVEVRGKAYSGRGAVTRVELSSDDGRTWTQALLKPRRPTGGWQSFEAVLPLSTGPAALLSRATDAAGRTQPLAADWNPAGYLYDAADRVAFRVGVDAEWSGAAVMRARCQSCHAPELLQAQRLSLPQWEAVLKKMQGFGARLSAGEREALLAYLAKFAPGRPEDSPRRAAYSSVVPAAVRRSPGDPARGGRLYAASCASCHGPAAGGETAPRLAGRALDPRDFRGAVLEGRGEMPGFGALADADLDDLAAYLRSL